MKTVFIFISMMIVLMMTGCGSDVNSEGSFGVDSTTVSSTSIDSASGDSVNDGSDAPQVTIVTTSISESLNKASLPPVPSIPNE